MRGSDGVVGKTMKSPSEHELQGVHQEFEASGVTIDKCINDLEEEYEKATDGEFPAPPTPMSLQQVSECEGSSPAKPPTKRARVTRVTGPEKVKLSGSSTAAQACREI